MPGPTLQGAWTLAPDVALRPERFGALAYHFGTRRLTFLKRPELATAVAALARSRDVAAALDEAGVAPARQPEYLTALRALAAQGVIQPREPAGAAR